MHEERIAELISKKGLLEGHFVLASGRHSLQYIAKHLLYADTDIAKDIGYQIALHFCDKDVEVVVGPAVGGDVLAYCVASAMNELYRRYWSAKEVKFVWADKGFQKEEGWRYVLREGFGELIDGKNVLIVDDVLTTGGSIEKVSSLIRLHGGKVVGAGVVCMRGNVSLDDLGVPHLFSLCCLPLDDFSPEDCPVCNKES